MLNVQVSLLDDVVHGHGVGVLEVEEGLEGGGVDQGVVHLREHLLVGHLRGLGKLPHLLHAQRYTWFNG